MSDQSIVSPVSKPGGLRCTLCGTPHPLLLATFTPNGQYVEACGPCAHKLTDRDRRVGDGMWRRLPDLEDAA